MLLLRLRQVQEEAEDGGDDSALLEFGVNQVAGARQRDLIAWYFDLLADRCAPPHVPAAGRSLGLIAMPPVLGACWALACQSCIVPYRVHAVAACPLPALSACSDSPTTLHRGQLEVPRPEEGEEDSDEAALWRREVAKVERVISHLIVKDGVLVVVQTPEVCSLWHHSPHYRRPDISPCTSLIDSIPVVADQLRHGVHTAFPVYA